MLKINVPGTELYNEQTEKFETVVGFDLELEHSLVSLSKWESKFEKPFLAGSDKTSEEIIAYVEAMCVTPNAPENFLLSLSAENFEAINQYINSKQSATTFGQIPETRGCGEIVTSELIYYWMVAFNIPFEAESWNLNRLFALVKICNLKNSKPKKMSSSQIAQRNQELNAQRKEQLGTRG